jgi:DNA-binding ferritin-like protein
VFIDLDFHQTLEARRTRARDRLDPFGERVLAIEHTIISQHRELADVLVTPAFSVEIPGTHEENQAAQSEGGIHAATLDS